MTRLGLQSFRRSRFDFLRVFSRRVGWTFSPDSSTAAPEALKNGSFACCRRRRCDDYAVLRGAMITRFFFDRLPL
ncbi:unnamed protein product [Arabidopsis halleri]